MARATFCFQGDLNFFLPRHQQNVNFIYQFKERPSIKDTIESLGVPHPEVNSIVVNGKAVDFSYLVRDEDCIIVYPLSVTPKIIPTISLQPPLPTIPRFILDVHLGKLASSLRMLGFDTLYRNDYEDAQIAFVASQDKRIVLTRDKGVLMRNLVTHGYYIRETNPDKQIIEVLKRFNLSDLVKPFRRCIRCNGVLTPVTKELIADQLPQRTKQEIDEFRRCNSCRQIYWQGAHYERMEKFVRQVLSKSGEHQAPKL
jgi:uncharacterized protein with PIN domain